MGVSGVTSSCERFCMNSVLARAAARRRLLAAVNSRTVASRRSTKDLAVLAQVATLVLALHFLALALEECAQLAGELLHVDRLLDVAVAADGEREAAVAVRGQDHDGAAVEPSVGAEPRRGPVAG